MKDMIMDIMKLAQGMLAQKLGGDNALVGAALNGLIGQGDKMDIGSLVSGFKDKGMGDVAESWLCLLYTSPSPRDKRQSRMPSSA